MGLDWRFAVACALLCAVSALPGSRTRDPRAPSAEELALQEHLNTNFEVDATEICNKLVIADWDFTTDINNSDKEEILVNVTLQEATFQKAQWQTWFRDAAWETYETPAVKRQAMFLSVLGNAALDEASLAEFNRELNTMSGIYGSARICPHDKQMCNIETDGIRLEPDMESTMAQSRDYDELDYVWSQWREAAGAPIRNNYKNYVKLSNEAAVANGFADMGEMWRADYETPDFEADVQRLWEEVKPLYQRLHAYAKVKLGEQYGDKMPAGKNIPAHIFGNMWAQSWDNIYDILEPFPNSTKVDITQNMIDQRYTVQRMFNMANEFYTSMGLESMDMSFGDLAIIEQPEGRDIVCHASAWDFCVKDDYRIKMCTNIDVEDFITVHHELGHIQYFLQYKDQPITFRKGANPGFHEAVGDVISLSVSTPQHYMKVGLLAEYEDSYQDSINTLLRSALSKVAFLPFAMVIDSWRWEVFSGATPEANWNQRWWELRRQYQMVDAPNVRTEEHFDPGAKYHVPGNSQYIAYFIAHILQFQMHKAVCIAAQQYDPLDPAKPLHKCDIYRSTAAGKILRDGLRLGGSLHWSEVLTSMTGEDRLSGAALLEYYKPLYDFLGTNTPAADAEPVNQTVPIVVGAILGAVVVAALTTYFVKGYRSGKKEKKEEAEAAAAAAKETS